jgi:hypothetical protein
MLVTVCGSKYRDLSTDIKSGAKYSTEGKLAADDTDLHGLARRT